MPNLILFGQTVRASDLRSGSDKTFVACVPPFKVTQGFRRLHGSIGFYMNSC